MIQHLKESSDGGIQISTSPSCSARQDVRASMRSRLMRLREKSLTMGIFCALESFSCHFVRGFLLEIFSIQNGTPGIREKLYLQRATRSKFYNLLDNGGTSSNNVS
jgi:hypothetical protein